MSFFCCGCCSHPLLSCLGKSEEQEDELEEEEEEDADLFDSAEDEEEDTMPPKKAAPKSAAPKKEAPATSVDELAAGVSGLSVNSKASNFELSFVGPFFVKSYVWNDQYKIQVDVYVPTLGEDNLLVNVSKDGYYLEVTVACPEVFYEADRIMAANNGVAGVDANSHLVTAHQDVVQEVRTAYATKAFVHGKPQRIKLPVKCQTDIEAWEIQNYATIQIDNGTVDAAGDPVPMQQYMSVLKVDLNAEQRRTQRKVRGRSRIIQTP